MSLLSHGCPLSLPVLEIIFQRKTIASTTSDQSERVKGCALWCFFREAQPVELFFPKQTHTQRKCNLQAPTWRDQHVVSKKNPLSDQYGFWSKAHVRMNVHNNDRIYHYDWIMGLSSTIWLDSWGLLGWFGSTECFFCFPKMVLVRQSVPNLN